MYAIIKGKTSATEILTFTNISSNDTTGQFTTVLWLVELYVETMEFPLNWLENFGLRSLNLVILGFLQGQNYVLVEYQFCPFLTTNLT
jgi:hypothetical protein